MIIRKIFIITVLTLSVLLTITNNTWAFPIGDQMRDLVESIVEGTKAIIRPPLLLPFSDDKFFVLMRDLEYKIGETTLKVTVPKGFVTDFASIPEPLWSFGLSPKGKYTQAAIVHDYLYWTQVCTRKQADNIMLIAMKEHGVSKIKRTEIYSGVRIGGKGPWKKNTEERLSKKVRFIPSTMLDFEGNISWESYREKLIGLGIEDPLFTSNPSYCELGNSTTIPE